MLVKIGEVATQYEISNRTLRYWEDAGILSSIRGKIAIDIMMRQIY